MTILANDIKFVESEVMDDVPEGGGAPTGEIILTGQSNTIFDDISELELAGGRVNLRKVFLQVQTENTDKYLGANVIIADPADDPNVRISLFATGDFFDRRDDAKARIESYLALGPSYPGYLFGNHIAGQSTITWLQRTNEQLPVIGETIVLRKLEGTASEAEQFVRITDIESSVRTFADITGEFDRTQVIAGISDILRYDFPGFDAIRLDSAISYTGKSKLYTSIVANASRYYSAAVLTEDISLGDFGARVDSIYNQLVPSAQAETPIADAKTNQTIATLSVGGPVLPEQTFALGSNWTNGVNVYIGGAIMPSTLTVKSNDNLLTITDEGGKLMGAGNQVGTIDYENGILSMTTSYMASYSTIKVTYRPAVVPQVVTQSQGILVSVETRALNYIRTIEPAPAPNSLIISYSVAGAWYVLREDGSGAIRGADPAFGAGTLNYSTGTVSVTLGALPDVDSAIIFQWADVTPQRDASEITLDNSGKFYWPINTSGEVSVLKGSKTIEPGGVTITWSNGGSKTAIDDGNGNITGDATGSVNYPKGVIKLSPTQLPPVGTTITVTLDTAVTATAPAVTLTGVGSRAGTIGAVNITPGSVEITLIAKRLYDVGALTDEELNPPVAMKLEDDGNGNLKLQANGTLVQFGTINYAAGTFSISSELEITGEARKFVTGMQYGYKWVWSSYYLPSTHMGSQGANPPSDGSAIFLNTIEQVYGEHAGEQGLAYLRMAKEVEVLTEAQLFINFADTATASVTYTVAAGSVQVISEEMNELQLRVNIANSFTVAGIMFTSAAGLQYITKSNGDIQTSLNRITGIGTKVGELVPAEGLIRLTAWPTNAATQVNNFRGAATAPVTGPFSPYGSSYVVLRTATAPLRVGSFSVRGTMSDGTTFNVTANSDGIINATRVKGRINYQTGVVRLYFVTPTSPVESTVDLSEFDIPGVTDVYPDTASIETLIYNAVAFTYLPLDAELLGIDPVRLPSDGRVPVFRKGSFVVIGSAKSVTATVSNGQVIDTGRERLSRVRVIDDAGNIITSGYTTDLDAGTITIDNISGWDQPVTIENRIEDMALVNDAQINGMLSFTRPISHDYLADGDTYVSSALTIGDMRARVLVPFDQATWADIWSDTLSGSTAPGTYNNTDFPITTSNLGALTERWAIRFTNSTTFQIIGEHVGVIGVGNTSTEAAPLNTKTGEPLFTIDPLGWGSGWATGNALRFNTIGATFGVWVVRTVKQGSPTEYDDSFALLARGNVDAP